MKEPLVSVIIPVFNGELFIAEAINSVLQQDYKNIEILVIDDGSTDNTSRIAHQFLDKIKYYYKKNGGQSSARNLGIEHSEGDYIAFLDADDIWSPTKLKKQIIKMQENKCMWSYTDAIAFLGNKPIYKFSSVFKQREGLIFESLLAQNFIVASSVVVYKEILHKLGSFSNVRREDWDLWLKISEKYKIDLVNEALVKYRIHNKSSLRTTGVDQKLKSKLIIINRALNRSPQISKKIYKNALSNVYFEACKLFLMTNEKGKAHQAIKSAIKNKKSFKFFLFFIVCCIPYSNILLLKKAQNKYRLLVYNYLKVFRI